MAKKCQACGKRLGIFERMFGDECHPCFNKRVRDEQAAAEVARAKRWEEQKAKLPWRVPMLSGPGSAGKKNAEHKASEREESWVEVMLGLAWILCFCAALVFGILAVVASNDSYEQGAAVVFTAYAISLMVSGIVFAAIGKIISALTSINENLRLLVSHDVLRGVRGKESDETAGDNDG
jgi:hypothetical protein